jgi:hypothetical protein
LPPSKPPPAGRHLGGWSARRGKPFIVSQTYA